MMMPVRQRCPSCGREFMGSDAIGDKCPNCKSGEINVGVTPCDCDCVDGKCRLDKNNKK